MQTPPPFNNYENQPQAPMKKKNNTLLIIFAVLGALLLCCGAPIGVIGYYGMKLGKGAMSMVGCMVNVDSMKTAMHKYSKDHDGKLPSAKNWQTELGKYMVFDKEMKDMPMTSLWKAGGEWSCDDSGIKTGFMFNEALSEKKIADVIKADPDAIAIFETKTVSFNQSGPLVKLPFAESPKLMGDLINERRGWLLINAEATEVYHFDKKGKLKPFDMNMNGSKKNGVDINFNSDSGAEKSDNSN